MGSWYSRLLTYDWKTTFLSSQQKIDLFTDNQCILHNNIVLRQFRVS